MSYIPVYSYIGNYPKDRENGISDELQGVCHDTNNWYFTQNRHRYRGNEASDNLGYIWKIPLSHDLNKKIGENQYQHVNCGTHHLGDIDFLNGFLFVPIDNQIAVFTNELRPVAIQRITRPIKDRMVPYYSIGWCAMNPTDGCLYTSDKHICSSDIDKRTSAICVYDIDFQKLNKIRDMQYGKRPEKNICDIDSDFSYETFLTYSHSLMPFYYKNDSPSKIYLHLTDTQGGCFDDHNLLHVVNGCNSSDYDNLGISVFNVPVKTTEEMQDSDIKRVAKSHQENDGRFCFQFNGFHDEPEGITFWDLNGKDHSPGFGGVLHAIMINNFGTGDDDLYFKHYNRFLRTFSSEDKSVDNTVIYYLNRNAQNNGEHEIHKEDCKFIPSLNNRILLGHYKTDEEALEVARRIFPKVDGCSHCCPLIDTDKAGY